MELDTHLVETADDIGLKSPLPAGTRAEKREVQVQRVLDAAKKCFVRSGFRGASMHEICVEAGMSPGALYRYFPSKESIIEAIAENNRREDLAFISQLGNGPSLIDGFMNAVMAHLRHVHSTGMGPLFTEIRAESMRNETVRNCCQQSESQFMDAFRAFVTKATQEGQLNPVTDVNTLVLVMMAVGEGLIFSNLPEQGVGADKLEPVLRAMVVAFLRPVDSNSQKKEI